MRYVIRVRDPRHSPGRIGWIGKPDEKPVEGPHPAGLKGYRTKLEAQKRMLLLGARYASARLKVMGFGPKEAQ